MGARAGQGLAREPGAASLRGGQRLRRISTGPGHVLRGLRRSAVSRRPGPAPRRGAGRAASRRARPARSPAGTYAHSEDRAPRPGAPGNDPKGGCIRAIVMLMSPAPAVAWAIRAARVLRRAASGSTRQRVSGRQPTANRMGEAGNRPAGPGPGPSRRRASLPGRRERPAPAANFARICYRIYGLTAGSGGQPATSTGSKRISGLGSARAAFGTQPGMETPGPVRPSCHASRDEAGSPRTGSSAGRQSIAARSAPVAHRRRVRVRTARQRPRRESDGGVRNPTANHLITRNERVVCRGSTIIVAADRKRMDTRLGAQAAAARVLPSHGGGA